MHRPFDGLLVIDLSQFLAGPLASLRLQDLLAQGRSGAMSLNGHDGKGPVPFGLPVADMTAGANLCHGI